MKRPQLMHEARIYKNLQGGAGIPKFFWAGEEAGYKVMVMERLGPSLEDLLFTCKNRFTLPTVVALADQLVCTSLKDNPQ